jgi:hypothetical protein
MGTRELYAFRQVAVNDALYIPFGLNAFADPIADLAGVIETQKGKFRVVAAGFYRGQICQISGEDRRSLKKKEDTFRLLSGNDVTRRSLPAPRSFSLLQTE